MEFVVLLLLAAGIIAWVVLLRNAVRQSRRNRDHDCAPTPYRGETVETIEAREMTDTQNVAGQISRLLVDTKRIREQVPHGDEVNDSLFVVELILHRLQGNNTRYFSIDIHLPRTEG